MVAGVANITAFGIGNFKVRVGYVVKGFLHNVPALGAHCLIKRSIDFVRHAIVFGGVNNGFIEGKHRILLALQVSGYLRRIGV